MNVIGSVGATANNKADISRPSRQRSGNAYRQTHQHVSSFPVASPLPTLCDGVAPRASRTPSSCLRWLTDSAITPAIPAAVMTSASPANIASRMAVSRGDATASLSHVLQSLNPINRSLRIDLIDRLAHQARDAHRISRRAHQTDCSQTRSAREEYRSHRWARDPDPYCFTSLTIPTMVTQVSPRSKLTRLPDRVLIVPAMASGGLIDHRNQQRLLVVLVFKSPTLYQRHANRLEVARTRRPKVGLRRRARPRESDVPRFESLD